MFYGSKVPREMEYDFLAWVDNLLVLSSYSVLGVVVSVLPLFSTGSVSELACRWCLELQHIAQIALVHRTCGSICQALTSYSVGNATSVQGLLATMILMLIVTIVVMDIWNL